MNNDELLTQLADIQGLDYISAWPLAWGWWLLIAATIGLIILLVWFTYKNFKYKKSWQYQSYQRLQNMQHHAQYQQLSEEVRHIAIMSTSRQQCAGLTGTKWLQWLTDNDPCGFNWTEYGQLLINNPYQPNSSNISKQHMHNLIIAIQTWVKK